MSVEGYDSEETQGNTIGLRNQFGDRTHGVINMRSTICVSTRLIGNGSLHRWAWSKAGFADCTGTRCWPVRILVCGWLQMFTGYGCWFTRPRGGCLDGNAVCARETPFPRAGRT